MASTLTNLLYHVVFSTKERQNIIESSFRENLYSYMGGIIRGEKGILISIGGTQDHIHIFMKIPPDVSVSHMLKCLKGNSSKWVNENKHSKIHFNWQIGYGAFTVSQSNIEAVIKYIEHQEEHHRKQTFKEELISLLEKNNIEYDERYLWI